MKTEKINLEEIAFLKDFTLKSNGESKGIWCNKVVLAMNSKYWRDWLRKNPRIGEYNVDFSAITVSDYIWYLYFQELPPADRCNTALLRMANRYEVVHLRDSLVDHLEKNLTRENVADVLEASEVCKIHILAKVAHQFLQREIALKNEIPGLDAVLKKYPQCQWDFDTHSHVTKVKSAYKIVKAKMEQERKELEAKMEEERKELEAKMEEERKERKKERKELEAKMEQERQDMEKKMELERQDMEAKMEQERQDMEAMLEQERQNMEAKLEQDRQDMDVTLEQESQDMEAKLEQDRQDMEAKLERERKELKAKMTEWRAKETLMINEQAKLKSKVAKLEKQIQEVPGLPVISEAP